MLRFEGRRDFPNHTPAQLFEKLRDARFLIQCVPDVHQIKSQEQSQAAFTLRPGFAFVRGTLDVTLQIVEELPSTLRVQLHSKGIGSSSDVETVLVVSAVESGARVDWTAEVKSLGGLLKAVPQGLVRGAAQKVVEDAWAAVETNLKALPA